MKRRIIIIITTILISFSLLSCKKNDNSFYMLYSLNNYEVSDSYLFTKIKRNDSIVKDIKKDIPLSYTIYSLEVEFTELNEFFYEYIIDGTMIGFDGAMQFTISLKDQALDSSKFKSITSDKLLVTSKKEEKPVVLNEGTYSLILATNNKEYLLGLVSK